MLQVKFCFCIIALLYIHCLIVKCGAIYKQQDLSSSWTKKVDKKVWDEHFLVTFEPGAYIWKKLSNHKGQTQIKHVFFLLFTTGKFSKSELNKLYKV